MARRLIHAPFPDLERALARDLRPEPGSAPAPLQARLLLVPHRLLARHLTRRLARETGGWLGLEALTLGRLAQEIAAPEFARDGRSRLTADGEELLLARAASEALQEGHSLHPLRDQPGLTRALRDTLRELGEASLTPEELDALAAGPGDLPAPARERLAGLASIWRAYASRLAARAAYDGAEAMRRAPALLGAAGSPAAAYAGRYRQAYLYGFFHLKPAELALVDALAGALDTTVFVPRGPEAAAAPAERFLTRLRALGFAEGEAGERTAPGGEAGALEAAHPPALRVFAAGSEEGEVREALRERLGARGDGPAAGTCAILYLDRATYAPLVRDAARECGLPVPVDGGAGGVLAPPARAAQLLLQLRLAGGSPLPGRTAVMEFASVAPLRRELAAETGGPPFADAWDRETRALGVRRGPDWRVAALSPGLREFRDALARALSGIPDRGLWGDFAAAMEASCALLFAPDSAAELGETWAGLRALDRVDDGTRLAEFARFAHRALARLVAGDSGDGPGVAATWSADLSAAAGVPADVVVVHGLVEGGLPRHPRGDPVLPDTERARVNLALRALGDPARELPSRADALDRERMLFHFALAGARREVILTFARTDPAADRERLPSPFLLELCAAATGEPPSYEKFAAWSAVRRFPLAGGARENPSEALDEGEFDRAIVRAGCSGRPEEAPRLRALLAARPALRARVTAQRARWAAEELNPHAGSLRAESLRGELARLRDAPASPSRLQRYASCPQRFYLADLLSLREWEEPERRSEPDARQRGQLYHEILRDFVAEAMREGLEPRNPGQAADCRRLMESIVTRRCAAARSRPGGGLFLYWEDEERRVRDDMERWLRGEMEEPAGFRPCEVELGFGEPPAPPVTVPAGEERLELRGRIDRVDVTPDGRRARIVDYKTGEVSVKEKDPFQGGRAIQLPLYALAAREILRGRFPALEVEEAALCGVRQAKGFVRRAFPARAWREDAAELGRICRVLLDGIGEGFFTPMPLPNEEGCSRCEFARVCGPAMERIGERAASFPEAAAFAALRGSAPEEEEEE